MGKETKDLLKTILINTELIMKHFNITVPEKPGQKKEKKVTSKKNRPIKMLSRKKKNSKK